MRKFKIFTFGGAGGNIASRLLNTRVVFNVHENNLVYHFNTDKQSFNYHPLLENKYAIGKIGLGSDNNIEVAKRAFDEDKTLFDRLTNEDFFYVLVGALSGGTGGGFLIKMTELLQQKQKKFIIIGSLPFHFEGAQKLTLAKYVVNTLQSMTDNIIVLPYENLVQELFGKLHISEAFRSADYYTIEVIGSIIGGIYTTDEQISNFVLNDKSIFANISKVKKYFSENNLVNTKKSKIIIPNINHELLKALTVDYELIYKISPRKFEEIIEYIYRMGGYETVLNKHTRDNGVDIIVYTPPPILGNKFITVVQAKRYDKNNKVGASTVRDLLGTKFIFNADKAQIITTSDFTKPAQETAKAGNIDLIKFKEFNNTLQELIKI